MTFRIPIIALAVLLLSGCPAPQKVVFIDQTAHTGRPTVREVRADGDTLQVALSQDRAPAWISSVHATVIEGDVYLSTLLISSVVHTTEFKIDMSKGNMPRDWRNRLYWIEGETITSPFNASTERVREIRRSKILLKP